MRQVARHERSMHLLAFGVRMLAHDAVRAGGARVLLGGDFRAALRAVDGGETVDHVLLVLELPDPRGKARRREALEGRAELVPEERLPRDREVARDFGLEEARQPRARREDEVARGI